MNVYQRTTQAYIPCWADLSAA